MDPPHGYQSKGGPQATETTHVALVGSPSSCLSAFILVDDPGAFISSHHRAAIPERTDRATLNHLTHRLGASKKPAPRTACGPGCCRWYCPPSCFFFFAFRGLHRSRHPAAAILNHPRSAHLLLHRPCLVVRKFHERYGCA